jgi:hypothetical protein
VEISLLSQEWSFRVDLDLRESLNRRLHPAAVVFQEDRNLIMGDQAVIDLDSEDDIDAAYMSLRDHRPLPLGKYLLLRGGDDESPWIYQAVVHDFELEPSCRPGDVRRSLSAILVDADKRGFRDLAAEPLGIFRGRGLTVDEVVEAFDTAILESSAVLDVPLRLTLLLEDMAQLEEVSHLLRSRVLSRAHRRLRSADGNAAIVEVNNHDHNFRVRFVPGTLSGYLLTRSDIAT